MANKSMYVNKHNKHTLHTCSNPIVINYRRKYINITKTRKDIEATVLITKYLLLQKQQIN